MLTNKERKSSVNEQGQWVLYTTLIRIHNSIYIPWKVRNCCDIEIDRERDIAWERYCVR